MIYPALPNPKQTTHTHTQGPVALGISFTTFDFLKKSLNVTPRKKAPL